MIEIHVTQTYLKSRMHFVSTATQEREKIKGKWKNNKIVAMFPQLYSASLQQTYTRQGDYFRTKAWIWMRFNKPRMRNKDYLFTLS